MSDYIENAVKKKKNPQHRQLIRLIARVMIYSKQRDALGRNVGD